MPRKTAITIYVSPEFIERIDAIQAEQMRPSRNNTIEVLLSAALSRYETAEAILQGKTQVDYAALRGA